MKSKNFRNSGRGTKDKSDASASKHVETIYCKSCIFPSQVNNFPAEKYVFFFVFFFLFFAKIH